MLQRLTTGTRLKRRLRLFGVMALLAFAPLLIAATDPSCQALTARQEYGVNIVLQGQSWDETSLNAVLSALDRLPSHVVNQLGSRYQGPLNILSNPDSQSLSGARVYSSGANFFSTNEGVNELVLYPNQGEQTVLHELGHAYQLRLTPPGKYAWVFFQEETRDFMRTTGWSLLSSDAEVAAALDQTQLNFAYDGANVWPVLSNFDPLEDYANTFALFFYNPSELQRRSPVRYDWMLRNVATDTR